MTEPLAQEARVEAERKSRDEHWCGDPDVFVAGAEWAARTLNGIGEEAYQRGHEDGFWNGKTTDMSPAQAATFMAPYRSRCPGCADAVDRAEGDGSADCGCAYCHTGPFPIMHVCADCGSKRCPRAIHHANPCNGRADQ